MIKNLSTMHTAAVTLPSPSLSWSSENYFSKTSGNFTRKTLLLPRHAALKKDKKGLQEVAVVPKYFQNNIRE